MYHTVFKDDVTHRLDVLSALRLLQKQTNYSFRQNKFWRKKLFISEHMNHSIVLFKLLIFLLLLVFMFSVC